MRNCLYARLDDDDLQREIDKMREAAQEAPRSSTSDAWARHSAELGRLLAEQRCRAEEAAK